MGAGPGENITPAQGAMPDSTAPVTCSAPLLPFAPSGPTSIAAFDLPPIIASVETLHPAPNFDAGFASSKSLTKPDFDPGGPGLLRASSAAVRSFSREPRQPSMSIARPAFHTVTMLRVSVMLLVGSPSTSTR